AEHQETIPGEIKEMPGMYQDRAAFEQADGEVFVRSGDRHSKDRVPAAFSFEARDEFRLAERVIQSAEIRGNSLLQLFLQSVPEGEELWQRKLHRRTRRKICVRDDFQAPDSGMNQRLRTAHHRPGPL